MSLKEIAKSKSYIVGKSPGGQLMYTWAIAYNLYSSQSHLNHSEDADNNIVGVWFTKLNTYTTN